MRRLDNAKTYNCPLRFTITDCESGWTDLSCDFYGTIIDIYISYLGYQPSALIEAVRIFHSHEISYRDNYCYSHIDIAKEEDIDTLEYWDMVPMVVEFAWEEEPRRSTWTISRDEKDFGKALSSYEIPSFARRITLSNSLPVISLNHIKL